MCTRQCCIHKSRLITNKKRALATHTAQISANGIHIHVYVIHIYLPRRLALIKREKGSARAWKYWDLNFHEAVCRALAQINIDAVISRSRENEIETSRPASANYIIHASRCAHARRGISRQVCQWVSPPLCIYIPSNILASARVFSKYRSIISSVEGHTHVE